MKKTVCILAVVLLLAACSGEREVCPQMRGVTFVAQVCYYNEQYTCNVSVNTSGVLKATVVSPEDISGLSVKCDGDDITAEYRGLTYTPKPDSLSVGGVAKTLYSVWEDIDPKKVLKVKSGENIKVEGRTDDTCYVFTFSPSGIPLNIKLPDESFTFSFNDFTVDNNK